VATGETEEYNGADFIEQLMLPVAVSSVDGGATWTVGTLPDAVLSSQATLTDLTCPTSTACYAVGYNVDEAGSVIATTNGGTTWTSQTLPPGQIAVAVACTSATDCVAEGTETLTTTDGGSTWTGEAVGGAAANYEFASMYCTPGSQDCLAVGDGSSTMAALTTTDFGAVWTVHNLAASVPLLSPVTLSCGSSLDCLMAGISNDTGAPVALSTTDGGDAWTSSTLPSDLGSVGVVSCPSATTCLVPASGSVDGQARMLLTSDLGSKWTDVVFPTPFTSFSAVSCYTTSDCVAAGYITTPFGVTVGVFYYTTNGGTSWTDEENSDTPQSVACGPGGLCAAALGFSGEAVLVSTTGGVSWRSVALPALTSSTGPLETETLTNLSCPSSTTCVGVGTAEFGEGVFDSAFYGVDYSTTDSGAVWTGRLLPIGVTPDSISCGSSTECVTVGYGPTFAGNEGTAFVTTDGGAVWSQTALPGPVANLDAVSCAGSSCTAVGDNFAGEEGEPVILDSTDGGLAWASESIPSGVSSLTEVSCPSASACVAAGEGPTGNDLILNTG
jgi:photosystem II stability/assembly factor-like uncharacterized protein